MGVLQCVLQCAICGSRITGWRRLTGCLKLQVIFRKRASNYRALLRKITCKDKTSYDSTPPCTKSVYGKNMYK